MGNAKSRSIEGHYNFYGYPAYILKQKNGAYASGFFDPEDKVFKAGGSVKKILWDGVRVTLDEAKRLMERHSKKCSRLSDADLDTPDWIMLPEDASRFLTQSDESRTEAAPMLKKARIQRKGKEQD